MRRTKPKNTFRESKRRLTKLAKRSLMKHQRRIWYVKCEKLVKLLMSDPRSLPYLEPMDLTKYTDYLDFVTEPMDFSSIIKKLSSKGYKSRNEVFEDTKLIFQNAMQYNSEVSVYHIWANELLGEVKTQWRILELELQECVQRVKSSINEKMKQKLHLMQLRLRKQKMKSKKKHSARKTGANNKKKNSLMSSRARSGKMDSKKKHKMKKNKRSQRNKKFRNSQSNNNNHQRENRLAPNKNRELRRGKYRDDQRSMINKELNLFQKEIDLELGFEQKMKSIEDKNEQFLKSFDNLNSKIKQKYESLDLIEDKIENYDHWWKQISQFGQIDPNNPETTRQTICKFFDRNQDEGNYSKSLKQSFLITQKISIALQFLIYEGTPNDEVCLIDKEMLERVIKQNDKDVAQFIQAFKSIKGDQEIPETSTLLNEPKNDQGKEMEIQKENDNLNVHEKETGNLNENEKENENEQEKNFSKDETHNNLENNSGNNKDNQTQIKVVTLEERQNLFQIINELNENQRNEIIELITKNDPLQSEANHIDFETLPDKIISEVVNFVNQILESTKTTRKSSSSSSKSSTTPTSSTLQSNKEQNKMNEEFPNFDSQDQIDNLDYFQNDRKRNHDQIEDEQDTNLVNNDNLDLENLNIDDYLKEDFIPSQNRLDNPQDDFNFDLDFGDLDDDDDDSNDDEDDSNEEDDEDVEDEDNNDTDREEDVDEEEEEEEEDDEEVGLDIDNNDEEGEGEEDDDNEDDLKDLEDFDNIDDVLDEDDLLVDEDDDSNDDDNDDDDNDDSNDDDGEMFEGFF
ncbi:bromodomain-containing protein [Anaeramoeba flamelloides]|uniref:Bromodomain-containing protein n=1 Tax=Anaeramoeba flamelloides TaxID=1746091 RepID=A0AAV7YS99_9EUKA|nr:bromodomain-containing protein [Anaeramoeba flamelloides]